LRGTWKWTLGALVVLALGGALFWRRGEEAPAPAAATTAAVERRTLEISVEASGQVEPVRVVEVKSRASGEVLRVLAETGDRVESGTLLAEIDPRDVANALDQAEADLASARVRARIAAAQVERLRRLLADGVVAQQELDTAEDAAASADSAVLRAETNLELARERRGDVAIRAPIAGTLLERQVETGQIIASATANVSGGTTLFRMADLSEMRVRAQIDETDIGRIRPGQPVRLTVEAYPGRGFTGVVEKIEPQAVVEQNVTQFPVLVRLNNREGLLLPGMSAEIALEVARRDGTLAVPNGAVVGSRDVDSAAQAVGVAADLARAALRGAEPAAAQTPLAGGGLEAECQALRTRLRGGAGFESLTDGERAQLAECRQRLGGPGGGRRDGAVPARADDGGERRTGLLFVAGAGGAEPRRVLFGLSDWEYTEVLEGVAEGERVLLVTVAQLQRQQQAMEQRFRERAGSFTGSPAPTPSRGR